MPTIDIQRRRLLAGTLSALAGIYLPRGLAAPVVDALPQRQAGSLRSHVAVVGAGLAGLAAARELQRAGHRVTVLEARQRPGGRVFSDRDSFSDVGAVERGAVVFSGSYQVASRYIDELGLERAPFLPPDLPMLHHVGGARRAVAAGDSLADLYSLTEAEAAKGPIGLVLDYFVKALPLQAMQPGIPPDAALRGLDTQSFADFLRRQGASEGAVKLIQDALYFGWDPENASALSIAKTDIGLFFQGDPMFVLAGGNSRLPEAMAGELGDNLHYGAQVSRLMQDKDQVRVRYRKEGSTKELGVDRVVLAVPAPVAALEADAFSLSQQYREALAALPQHDILRVQFGVDGAFWRGRGESGAAVTDLFGGRVDRQPYSDVGEPGRPAVLDALIVGDDAARLARLDDGDLEAAVAEDIAAIHPGFAEHRQGVAIQRWVSDPLTLGGWSWPGPGFVSSHLAQLQKPDGRIHFAGEHTSLLRATMEGALQSGVGAARQIDSFIGA